MVWTHSQKELHKSILMPRLKLIHLNILGLEHGSLISDETINIGAVRMFRR